MSVDDLETELWTHDYIDGHDIQCGFSKSFRDFVQRMYSFSIDYIHEKTCRLTTWTPYFYYGESYIRWQH